jgi:hypothetical protein
MALLTAEQLHEPARAESIEWPRTARKQPLVIPAAGGTPAIYTRATTFAGALEETSSLTKWKQRLTLLGAGLNRRLADAAARLDPAAPEGKKELNRLAWKAFVLGGGEKAQQQGTWRHLLTEYHDRGEELPSHSAEDAADLAAYVEATRPLQMLHIEEPVVLDRYRIAGTPDRILQTDLRTPDGRPAGIVIGDTKTGSIDLAALKIAMQLATYSRARLYNPVRHLSARPGEGEITEWRKRMFTREEAEAAYLAAPGREGFERPYGLAWLLQLAAELREWTDPDARRWSEHLEPLEDLCRNRLTAWLPKLTHPIRSGEHSQTAFAMGLALDWARTAQDAAFEKLLIDRALDFHLHDHGWPLAFEPSGHDFLSPSLAEADLVRRVMAPVEFADWLGAFLPAVPRDGSGAWLEPVTSPDPADGKLAHLDGLSLSRAWMLEGIVSGLPPGDSRVPALKARAFNIFVSVWQGAWRWRRVCRLCIVFWGAWVSWGRGRSCDSSSRPHAG